MGEKGGFSFNNSVDNVRISLIFNTLQLWHLTGACGAGPMTHDFVLVKASTMELNLALSNFVSKFPGK